MAKRKSTKPQNYGVRSPGNAALDALECAEERYPPDTEDRLCDVAGSLRSIASLLEHLPSEIMERDDGYVVNVIHQLQIIEREVRAIVHSAVEL